VWLTRYPRPERCIFDNGNEFLGKDFQDQLETHGIKAVPTTVKNPQANYVERVHQTLGNILRTKALDKYKFDYEDPWSDILAQAAWAIRSTVHTLYDATPGQLVFGRDMIYDLSFKPEWDKLLQK
jgi:transposase InsO family protein